MRKTIFILYLLCFVNPVLAVEPKDKQSSLSIHAAMGSLVPVLSSVRREFKRSLNREVDRLISLYGLTGSYSTGGGFPVLPNSFELQLNWQLLQRAGIGLRTAYMGSFDLENSADVETGKWSYHESWKLSPSMGLPLMVGVWGKLATWKDATIQASVFAGPGYARARIDHERVLRVPAQGIDERATGSGRLTGSTIALELTAQVDYSLDQDFSIFLEAGYRRAKVKNMTFKNDADLNADGIPEYSAGDPLRDQNGQPMNFNYSAMKFHAGIRLHL